MRNAEVKLATGQTFAGQRPPSPQAIAPFCYPLGRDELQMPAGESAKLKHTFTLMDADGRPLHGFCRRHALPRGDGDASEVCLLLLHSL